MALRLITASHNVILCFLSFLMAIRCALFSLHQSPPHNLSWPICFPLHHTSPRGPTFFWAHVFYFSKILEFIDTPPERIPFPKTLLPPCVPPRYGSGYVLPVALDVAVAVPGGSGDKRVSARAGVRVLSAVCGGYSSIVKEIGDRLSDYPVCLQLLDFGSDAVPPFQRVGL